MNRGCDWFRDGPLIPNTFLAAASPKVRNDFVCLSYIDRFLEQIISEYFMLVKPESPKTAKTHLHRKENRKPTEHSFRKRFRENTHHNVFVKTGLEIAGETMNDTVFLRLECNGAISIVGLPHIWKAKLKKLFSK